MKSILINIFEWIKKNPSFFMLITIVVLIMLLVSQCNKKNYYKNINEQNLNYYTDSLRIEKNKVGDLEYKHNILIADKKTLEDKNKDLFDELQKEKGNVKIIIKYQTVIVHDTIRIKDTIIKNADGTYDLKWEYVEYFTKDSANYQMLDGLSNFKLDTTKKPIKPISLGTMITKNVIGLNIVTGIDKNMKTGAYEIFVRSNYPNFTISKLDGAIVDPKMINDIVGKKKFGVGPNISVGIGANFKPSIYIGIGLQWNIIRF